MKSKASIKSHPLHPILVSFPIAFFIGTLIFDLLGLCYDNTDFFRTATFLTAGGIGSALLAAIPGIIDYLTVVPPDSSGKKRATKHGLTNITVVIIFSITLWLRQQDSPSYNLILALEVIGVILLSIAGWMGGTLVYRNQIGVDIRYANAGKWEERHLDEKQAAIEAASSDEIKLDQMKLFHVGDKRIVICRTEKGLAAFDDRCTHRGGSLAAGALICSTVQCPWHGSHFNVHDGAVKAGPAKEKIKTYPVAESNGKIFLTV
jgi:uncharacterized membrane protein/nitrite reductase/ring-hydroxylating ferredoxin subunit